MSSRRRPGFWKKTKHFSARFRLWDPTKSLDFGRRRSIVRRRTRVWALAPKPESVDASFLLFCHIVRSQVMGSSDKKSILSCCLNEVFGEVRSTSVSFAINLCAQSMSYQNQHSLSQPYWNLLFFPLFFPHEICLIVASVFIQLSCNNTFGSVCGKERKSKSHTRYFFFQELTIPNQQTKKAASLFGNFSVFPWIAKKSSEIRLGFAANGFVFFPLSFYRGCQIIPPRGFRELSWTRPPVYEIPFHEKFSWTGEIAGGE